MKIDHNIVAVIVENDGKFLLTEEFREGKTGLFNVPGGHVKEHESLVETAVREAKEESGYDVEIIGLVGIYQTIFENGNYSSPILLAKVTGGEAASSELHPSVRWVTRRELAEIIEAGQLITTYPPHAIDRVISGDTYPLDVIVTDRTDQTRQ